MLLAPGDARNTIIAAMSYVGFEPPPEAAAEEVVVRPHFLERQARSFRCILLDAREDLGPDPGFATIWRDMDCAVERLHRCVCQKRQFVLGIDPFTLGETLGNI